MNRIPSSLIAFGLVLSLSGCGSANPSSTHTEASDTASGAESAGWYSTAQSSPSPQNENTITRNAKIIWQGEMALETQDFEASDQFLRNLTTSTDGYLESTSVSGKVGYREAFYTARIPQKQYESFMVQVGENCHVLSSSTDAQDITEVYVDTEARLQSLKTKHTRLLALLEKADSMDSIVALETELADTEYEMERLTGSLRKYDSLVDFSTVALSLSEVASLNPVAEGNAFLSELSQSFQSGTAGLFKVLRSTVLIVVTLWPVVVIGGFTAAALFLLRKRRRAEQSESLPVDPPESASNTDPSDQ